MTSPETTAIFTRSWSLYDLLTEYNYMFHREIYKKIEDILKLRGDHGHYRLLDLGCGNGHIAGRLAALGYEVTGVDASPSGIRIAERTYPSVRFVEAMIHRQ